MGSSTTCQVILFAIIMFLLVYIFAHCGKEYFASSPSSFCPNKNHYDVDTLNSLDYPAFLLACGRSNSPPGTKHQEEIQKIENYSPDLNSSRNNLSFQPTSFNAFNTPAALLQQNKKVAIERYVAKKYGASFQSPDFQKRYKYLPGSNQGRKMVRKLERFCGACG